MKIFVCTIVRNREELMPFFCRHYSRLTDSIQIWDDHSTDATRLKATCSKVHIHDWPYDNGIDEDQFLQFAYITYPLMTEADWVIWVDADEFIYHPNLRGVLEDAWRHGYEVIRTDGYNMTHPTFPADDGKSQIWELVQTGVRAPVYSKPIIFSPYARVRWSRGKHSLDNCKAKITPEARVKLLHYRYLGAEYTRKRNAENYDRCCAKTGDKNAAWTCAPTWKGDHSPEWAEEALNKSVNVIAIPDYDYEHQKIQARQEAGCNGRENAGTASSPVAIGHAA